MACCLVTGASGYIGSRLTKFLLNQNYQVIALVRANSSLALLPQNHSALHIVPCNIDENNLFYVFQEYPIDIVFHLAADSRYGHSYEDISGLIDANIKFGAYLLEAMSQAGCNLLVNTGSFFETGEAENYNPQYFYAATKYCFQNMIDYYASIKKIKAITLRLMDVYGPSDPRNKLWPQLVSNFKNPKLLQLSAGEQLINLVHVLDVCSAFFTAWQQLKKEDNFLHKKYYAANTEQYSLKEIVNIFEKVAEQKLAIEWGARPYRDMEIMTPFVGELLPNWCAEIKLVDGFRSLLSNKDEYE